MHSLVNPADRAASRRNLLRIAAGVFVLAGVGTSRIAEAADKPKATQKSVDYQSHPKGGKGCNSCKFFEPPSKCKIVESFVEAGGWCDLYAPS